MSKYVYPKGGLPNPRNSKLLALVGEDKQVLEVGSGMGYHTRSLSEIQRCRVTCIEIDADAAAHARPYCHDVIVGDVETLDLAYALQCNQFDVITFGDVLEHLKNPVATLNKLRPLLRAGGYVAASIPNITHCSVIYEMARGRFDYRPLGLLDDTHIRFFTRQQIFNTFEAAGFQIVALERLRVQAFDTEFKTSPETEDDRLFLEYIKQRNPEAETYQFIVKATLAADTIACQSELIAAQEQLRLAQVDVELHRKRISELQSDLEWLTTRPTYKFLSALRRVLKP